VTTASARRSVGDVQRWFADAVTLDEAPPEGAIVGVLTPGPRMSAADRLEVYRSGYRARLVECLADDYPATKHWIGDAGFEALARRYVDAHPSRSPSLNGFGQKLPGFLGASGVDMAAFGADLARLEWALVDAIHAAPAAPISPERIAAVPAEAWAGARLRAAPSVRLLRFDHPVDAYYQAFRDGRAACVAVEPSATLVHRREWVVWRRALTAPMASVLEALLGGAPLGEALGASGAEPADVTTWFHDWVAGAVFSDVL
jgi:hypothetical protein